MRMMIEQLRFLPQAAEWPQVDLRIVSVGIGWHPGLEGPFLLVEFDDRAPVVQIENRRSALFFHEPDDVEAYQQAVNWVREVAMSPADTTRFIADVIKAEDTTTREPGNWRKSTRSQNTSHCVEVGRAGEGAAIRDTKNPAAGHLATTPGQWSAFVNAIKDGKFDI